MSTRIYSPARQRVIALLGFATTALALAALTGCTAGQVAQSVDVVDAPLVATNAPTTVETNTCNDVDGVVTVYDYDELDCDVVPPQQLNWQVWTDPAYGVMTADEFAIECADAGGILDPV